MKRYCGMCDRIVTTRTKECPLCGADTEKLSKDDLQTLRNLHVQEEAR